MKRVILLLALFFPHAASHAYESPDEEQLPVYAGVQFGSVSSDFNVGVLESGLGTVIGANTVTVQDSLSSKEIFAGAYIYPFLIVELSRIDFGEFLANTTTGTGTNFANQELSSTNIKLILSTQIRKRFSIHAGIGLYLAKLKQTTDIALVGSENLGKLDHNGSILTLGASFNVSQNLLIRIDYNRYNNIGRYFVTGGASNYNFNTTTIGIAYLFE